MNLGFEFFTDLPKAAFDLPAPPTSVDNWVRYTKLDQDGKPTQPQSAVVCSQGKSKAAAVETFNYNDFANGYNKQARR